jgi:hypothetical protein
MATIHARMTIVANTTAIGSVARSRSAPCRPLPKRGGTTGRVTHGPLRRAARLCQREHEWARLPRPVHGTIAEQDAGACSPPGAARRGPHARPGGHGVTPAGRPACRAAGVVDVVPRTRDPRGDRASSQTHGASPAWRRAPRGRGYRGGRRRDRDHMPHRGLTGAPSWARAGWEGAIPRWSQRHTDHIRGTANGSPGPGSAGRAAPAWRATPGRPSAWWRRPSPSSNSAASPSSAPSSRRPPSRGRVRPGRPSPPTSSGIPCWCAPVPSASSAPPSRSASSPPASSAGCASSACAPRARTSRSSAASRRRWTRSPPPASCGRWRRPGSRKVRPRRGRCTSCSSPSAARCLGRLVHPGEPGPLAPLGRGVSVGQSGVHSEPPTTPTTAQERT